MTDPKAELREYLAGRLYDTYGQQDRERSLALADAVLSLFTVRAEDRDIEITAFGDTHQRLLRHRWLVAEVCAGVRTVFGEPLGYLVDAESPDYPDDDLYPGAETGNGDLT